MSSKVSKEKKHTEAQRNIWMSNFYCGMVKGPKVSLSSKWRSHKTLVKNFDMDLIK